MGKEKIDPTKVLELHIVSDGVLTKGWVHTHGMAEFNLPELEIKNVPLFLASPAAGLINHIADYLLNSGKKVSLGETMSMSPCVS